MSRKKAHAAEVSRRDAIRMLGVAIAAAPLASFACGDTSESADEEGDDAGSSNVDDTADAQVMDASVGATDASDAASASADASEGTGWASGGTAAMTALAGYPNPFAGAVDTTCTPTCAMVLGPCHDDQAPEREDISEGQTGLPMRFGLRILDTDCQPVSDADVDIWHCDVRGVYSSETNDTPSFCTGDEAAALASRWFRGHRQTDADGVAWFNTCFPGWYNGRAIHIHFTIRRPNREGSEYLTSQIAFPTALITELCGSHPDYAAHGQPNTPNASDSIIPDEATYVVETQRMSDGALLAYKTIIIRSSLSGTVCSVGNQGGGGMMGGPPGGGMPPSRDGGMGPAGF